MLKTHFSGYKNMGGTKNFGGLCPFGSKDIVLKIFGTFQRPPGHFAPLAMMVNVIPPWVFTSSPKNVFTQQM